MNITTVDNVITVLDLRASLDNLFLDLMSTNKSWTKALLLMLGMFFHFTVIIVGMFWLGVFLDRQFPMQRMSWIVITSCLGLGVIVQSFVMLFRYLLKQER